MPVTAGEYCSSMIDAGHLWTAAVLDEAGSVNCL